MSGTRTLDLEEAKKAYERVFDSVGGVGVDFKVGWASPVPLKRWEQGSRTISLYHSRNFLERGSAFCLEVPWAVRIALLKKAGEHHPEDGTIDFTVNKAIEGLTLLRNYTHSEVDERNLAPATPWLSHEEVNVTYPFSYDLQLPLTTVLVRVRAEQSPLAYLGISLDIVCNERERADRYFPDELAAIVDGACSRADSPVVKNFRDYAIEYFIPIVRSHSQRWFTPALSSPAASGQAPVPI